MVAWRGNSVVSTQPTVVPLNFMEEFFALNHTNSCDVNRNSYEDVGRAFNEKKKKRDLSHNLILKAQPVFVLRGSQGLVWERYSICCTSFPRL